MFRTLLKQPWWLALLLIFAFVTPALAEGESGGGHVGYAVTFAWIAVLVLIACLAGMIERFSLPPVLGELSAGGWSLGVKLV